MPLLVRQCAVTFPEMVAIPMQVGFSLPLFSTRTSREPLPRTGGLLLLVVGLLLLLPLFQPASAQTARLTIHPKSQFWIQGEATTHTFTCRVEQVDGEAAIPSTRSTPTATDEEQTEVRVEVPVEAFNCGNNRMTRDLQETLKMEEHPKIRFELVHATVTSTVDTAAHWRQIEVLGALTIAGKKRLTRLQANGRALDENRFRVRGCHPVRMTYYGIEPPTKALGLIKVKNRVEVQFDLLAHTQEQDPGSFDTVSITEAPACSST